MQGAFLSVALNGAATSVGWGDTAQYAPMPRATPHGRTSQLQAALMLRLRNHLRWFTDTSVPVKTTEVEMPLSIYLLKNTKTI